MLSLPQGQNYEEDCANFCGLPIKIGNSALKLFNSYYKLKSQQIRKSFDQINIQFHFDAFNYFYKWQKVLVFSLLQTCYSYIQPNNLSIALINSSY